MNGIIITPTEFWAAISILVMLIVSVILHLAIAWKTPAWTFLKGSMKRLPLIWIITKSGQGFFRLGQNALKGSAEVKGFGLVNLTERSQVREEKTGSPVYKVFAENSSSIPDYYDTVVEILREKHNIIVNTFSDYKRLVDLATKEEYAQEQLDLLKDEKKKAKLQALIDKLKNIKLEIKPYQSYTMHNLNNMFPFNIDPSFIESEQQRKINNEIKRQRFTHKVLPYIGVLVILAGIGFYIILTALANKNMCNPETIKAICSVARPAVENVAHNVTLMG